jgi:hypothetical protein
VISVKILKEFTMILAYNELKGKIHTCEEKIGHGINSLTLSLY